MEPVRQPSPLIVIVGPTASGKSVLALELAKQFDGEIICADSRTVYRGMDIGTAKPSEREQAEIPHHIINVVDPDESFTAAEFKRRALLWIDDITLRGKLPIIVGGTGLYVDGVVFDFAFLPPVPTEEREQLQALSVAELQQKLDEQNIPLPSNAQNPRHLIRALETNGAVAIKKGLRKNTLMIGMDTSKEELAGRIENRVQAMVSDGLEAEVKELVSKYSWQVPGLTAVGYKEWQLYFTGKQEQAEVIREIIRDTMQYAKRQRTWFRRNTDIKWIKNSAEASRLVKSFLQQQA